MKGMWIGLVVLALGVSVAMAQPTPPATGDAKPRASAAQKLKVQSVTLHIFHRAFENFHDQVDARPNQEFRIGDSDYTGVVTQFVADFNYDMKTKKVTSRTNEPNNPAFRVLVKRRGQPQDTTWAFLNMPPHFAKKSLIAFLATRIQFDNHEPVTSRDSLGLRLMELEKR